MSCTPNDPTAPAFLTHFQSVEDPRQQGKVLYPLEEIFLLVLCGVISGADGWTSIALYGQKGCDSHMGRFLFGFFSPIETFAKVEAMSESRSIEDLPIVICCSFEWIPVFS